MREAQKMLLDTRSQATQFVGLVGQVGQVGQNVKTGGLMREVRSFNLQLVT